MNDFPLDSLVQLWDANEPLRRVESAIFPADLDGPPMTTGYRLWFGNTPLTLRAEPDFDELLLDLDGRADHPEPFTDRSNADIWVHQIGRRSTWFWRLTNQQGYNDGLRIELVDDDSTHTEILEFVVVASAIELYYGQRVT